MRRRHVSALLVLLGALTAAGCGVPDRNDAAPRARLSAPIRALVGAPVLLDASASFDPDGLIVSYTFWTGDGSSSTTLVTPELRHAFRAPGAYEIAVVVRDAAGQLSRATQLIVVGDERVGCRVSSDCPMGGECRPDEGLCFTAAGGGAGIAECESDSGCAAGSDCHGGVCLRPSAAPTP